MGIELLVETGLCVQLHILFYFEREISAYFTKRRTEKTGFSGHVALSQSVPFWNLALPTILCTQFSASGSLPQSSGSVIGIPESEMQVPNDSVLVTSWSRAGTLQ